MGNCLKRRRAIPPPVKDDGPRSIKIVLVGASTVGKTCLIVTYNTGQFNENYVPSVLDVFTGEREFNNQPVKITIVDTSGDDNLGAHRQLTYNGADCFMVCAAANDRASFERV